MQKPTRPSPEAIGVHKTHAGELKIKHALLAAIAVVIALGLLIHALVADQKRKEIKSTAARMDAFTKDWNSDLQIASATSRIALAGPVMKLREREEELDHLKVPECLATSKSALMAHVRASIESFTSFMSQQEALSSVHMTEAAAHFESYRELKAICEKSLK